MLERARSEARGKVMDVDVVPTVGTGAPLAWIPYLIGPNSSLLVCDGVHLRVTRPSSRTALVSSGAGSVPGATGTRPLLGGDSLPVASTPTSVTRLDPSSPSRRDYELHVRLFGGGRLEQEPVVREEGQSLRCVVLGNGLPDQRYGCALLIGRRAKECAGGAALAAVAGWALPSNRCAYQEVQCRTG